VIRISAFHPLEKVQSLPASCAGNPGTIAAEWSVISLGQDKTRAAGRREKIGEDVLRKNLGVASSPVQAEIAGPIIMHSNVRLIKTRVDFDNERLMRVPVNQVITDLNPETPLRLGRP